MHLAIVFSILLTFVTVHGLPLGIFDSNSNRRLLLHPRHRRLAATQRLTSNSSASIPPIANNVPLASFSIVPPSPSVSIVANSTLYAPPASTIAVSSNLSQISTLNPASTSIPSVANVSSSSSGKYVVCHHMVGNTFPYTQQDWSDDIALAYASGIDGFALNMGIDDWQPQRVADAYEAARQSETNFKLFISLDMSSLPCASPSDAQALRNQVLNYTSHPSQLQYQSRALVSTFSGESCTFGASSVPNGWQSQFSGHPDLEGKIFFMPAFFIDPSEFNEFANVMDGEFNWNSGWPIQVTTSFASTLVSPVANVAAGVASTFTSGLSILQSALSKFIGSTDSDIQYLNALNSIQARSVDDPTAKRSGGTKSYMAAVSPWFFTHYGKDSFNKNFIFLADQHLYAKRWESVISSRNEFDLVEIITWNDYGESHYIGPIKGSQPNSQAWVDGMDHTGWLALTKYYTTAFKTGTFPTIEKDQIYMWARTHSGNAQAPDPVGQPANFQLSADTLWAVVLTTAPSTVVLSTSSSPSPPPSSDPNTQTFNVPAGLTKLSLPLLPGSKMYGRIERTGVTVVEVAPQNYTFISNPQIYNFNAFVTSASAP